jgi:hypothetical protein
MIRGCVVFSLLAFASAARADRFDDISNPEIGRLIASGSATAVETLTATAVGPAPKLGGSQSAVVFVRTREGRSAKLLLQFGYQKLPGGRVPMALIERFATFKDGEERTVTAKGGGTQLFAGLQFGFDLGQALPPAIGGDLDVQSESGQVVLRPVNGAKLFLLGKPLDAAAPGVAATAVTGGPIEPKHFNGRFKLFADGRRSGQMTLTVAEPAGEVTGHFYSDKDGRKYEVTGKLGPARHQVQLTIRYPQSVETLSGWLFTGDGQAIAGVSRLGDREAGFYATRMSE